MKYLSCELWLYDRPSQVDNSCTDILKAFMKAFYFQIIKLYVAIGLLSGHI